LERLADGVNVAVVPEAFTTPGTDVAPCFNVKVTAVIDEGVIISLKLILSAVLIGALTAALTGAVRITVGAVVSNAAPVVKLHE